MGTHRRRRLPTSAELATWRAHIETFEAVRSRMESQLQRDSGLSSGDYRVLLALSEAEDQRLRSSDLASRIDWERSRLSGHLGRMEKRALIRRERCPDDARGSHVVLTDEGSRAFHGSTRPHLQAVKDLFIDAFTPDELADLGRLAEVMRHHLASDQQGDRR